MKGTKYNKSVIAELIERFVSNPNLSSDVLGAEYGMSGIYVTMLISQHWFGPSRKEHEIIVRQSSI